MALLTRIWGAAEALAGSLSVGFILLIGLVLVVFAGVYLVAAFVVLARFARSAKSLRVIATSALLICPLYAALWSGTLHLQKKYLMKKVDCYPCRRV